MSGIRWTCKSTRNLAKELCAQGHTVSHTTVAEELHGQQYSLQGNQKTKEGSAHPDRNGAEQTLTADEKSTLEQSLRALGYLE